MSPIRRQWPWIAVVALFVVSSSVIAATADRDAKEISAYKLTDAGLAKYATATRHLDEAVRRSPALCEERANDDGEDTKTLDKLVAKIDANPQMRQAIQSAGMSTREYAVFSFAILQAGMSAWALDQPGGKLAPGVSMDNVNFYRRNADALAKIGDESKAAEACDAESESGGYENEPEDDPGE